MTETEDKSVEELTDSIRNLWSSLSPENRLELFGSLARLDAEEVLMELPAYSQAEILGSLSPGERRSWFRLLPPDDAADVIQAIDPELKEEYLSFLDISARSEVTALLTYQEDQAGGLMNPRFASIREEMTVDEAITYLRLRAREFVETVYYLYVLDQTQHLLGVVSLRELLAAEPGTKVSKVMTESPVKARPDLDQESLSRLFEKRDLLAVPVVDDENRMIGIVTIDDIVDVVHEEATEDIYKAAAVENLGQPYLEIGLSEMIKKRIGWLVILFVGEMLTATAMGHYEDEISRAVVLALFVPLIISSGGNCGSQASTIIIRSLALTELRLSDWRRVLMREASTGLALGAALGLVGTIRILAWQFLFHTYGPNYPFIAATVGLSLVGVVLFGTLSGSMLPFLLRRVGFDPASASAPFVATMVDVTGLIIYFSVASVILKGILL